MRRTLSLLLVLSLLPAAAFGQPGTIQIFGDPAGTQCEIMDTAPGLFSLYVVHVFTPGATAAQFSAPKPWCMADAIYLSDTAVYAVTLGNSQSGVAIGYGACVPSPNHILTMNFFAQGTTLPCCCYYTSPDPLVPSGEIEVVDCANEVLYAFRAPAVINFNHSCLCWDLPDGCINGPVPIEDTTWGQVKSIYGD